MLRSMRRAVLVLALGVWACGGDGGVEGDAGPTPTPNPTPTPTPSPTPSVFNVVPCIDAERPPLDSFGCSVSAASADGSILFGTRGSGGLIWRWRVGDAGVTSLTSHPNRDSLSAASADGSVLVGTFNALSPANFFSAYLWTAAGGANSFITGSFNTFGNGISANGLVVVGSVAAIPVGSAEAFRWTQTGGIVRLGGLLPSNIESTALGVSADGQVVVGQSSSANTGVNEWEAFRWTQADGMVGLGDLPGGTFRSSANLASHDGSVIAGQATSGIGAEAFRWTQAGGMVSLGAAFTPRAMSADGSVIVGDRTVDGASEAMIWTQQAGLQRLADVIMAAGGDLQGLTLLSATAVSVDGAVVAGIAGSDIEPGGHRSWFARLR